MTTPSWLGPIKQISYTTDDIEAAVRFWDCQVGIGPFSVFRGLVLTMNFEGRPIAIPVDAAIALHGGQLFELMHVLADGPSPFHDPYGQPIIGLQRLASVTETIEADCARARAAGMEQFAEGQDASGQRYVYFRSPAAPGVILELLEDTPMFREFLAGLEAASAGAAGR